MEVPCTPDRLQNFLQESQKQHKPRREPVKDELGPRDSQTQVHHAVTFSVHGFLHWRLSEVKVSVK